MELTSLLLGFACGAFGAFEFITSIKKLVK